MERSKERILCIVFVLIFIFSLCTFRVAIEGPDAPIHLLKPVVSITAVLLIIWLSVYGKILNNSYRFPIIALAYIFAVYICSFNFSIDFIQSTFAGDYYFLPYIGIVFACFLYNPSFIVFLKKLFIISVLAFLLIFVIYRETFVLEDALDVTANMAEIGLSVDAIAKSLLFCSGFFLLLIPCLNKRLSIFLIASFSVCFIYSLFLARRNLIVTITLFYLFALWVLYFNLRHKRIGKFLFLCFFIVVALLGGRVVIEVASGDTSIDLLSNLARRGAVDSREHVLIPFLRAMNSNPFNWVFGRGIDASYNSDLGVRKVIETGYLQIISKIGIVGLFFYVIILIKAILLTKKGNSMMRACRLYIIICMIETLYAGVPTFELKWFLLWACVGFCYSPHLRNLSDSDIKLLLSR